MPPRRNTANGFTCISKLCLSLATLGVTVSTPLSAQRLDRAGAIASAMSLRFGPATAMVCGTVGIRAESRRDVRSISDTQLRRGAVIARIYSSAQMPSAGLAAGWNFIFVDSTRQGWRMLIIPQDRAARLVARRLGFVDHPTTDLQSPIITCPVGRGGDRAELWAKCGGRCCCSEINPVGCFPPDLGFMLWTPPSYDAPIPAPNTLPTGRVPTPSTGDPPLGTINPTPR